MSRNAERRSIKWHAAFERASEYTLMGPACHKPQASKASEQAYLLDALIEIEGSHGGQGSSNRSAGASEMAERGREQQTKERRSESERVGLAPSVEQSCCSSLLALSCFLNWTWPQNRLAWIDDWIGCSSFDLDAAQPSTLFGARRCRRGRGGSSRSGTRSSLSLQSLAHTLRHPPNVSTPLLMYQRRQLHMRTLCDDQWRTWHGLRASKQAKQAMSVCVYGSLNRSRRTFRSSTPGGSWHTTCTPRASRS